MTEAYFHGGVGGLEVGERLVAPARSRFAAAAFETNRRLAEPEASVYGGSAHFHYVTTELELARLYAWGAFGELDGSVYRVSPKGSLHRDDYIPADVSWLCESSVILEVVERDVDFGDDELHRLYARYFPDRPQLVPGAAPRSAEDFWASLGSDD